jgi:serine/threonine-protein kinase
MDRESVASLLKVLAESGLVQPHELDELTQGPTRFRDAQQLGQYLRERGWLTAFQLERLFQGMGRSLLLGHYQLLEPLGGGATGQVFKARHHRLKRIVALKTLDTSQFTDPAVVARFDREAQAAAQLAHPNVVLLYDAGQDGDTHFLAMEYVDGIDLDRFVQHSGPLPVAQACDYTRQAARGLHHMHERGLVHRDIKPANLLLTQSIDRNGQPLEEARRRPPPRPLIKILDLGLARFATPAPEEQADGSLSRKGETLGTPDYLAPEQALDSRRADHRSDIYSLGCTFYYLLTGKPPCGDGSLAQKLMWHQSDQPPPLDELRPGLPPDLSALVLRMVNRDPDARPQSAADIAAALQPFSGPDSRQRQSAAAVGSGSRQGQAVVPVGGGSRQSAVGLPPATAGYRRANGWQRWVVRGTISVIIWAGVLVGVWALPFHHGPSRQPTSREAVPDSRSSQLVQETAFKVADWRPLFNGTNLDGWDAATDAGTRADPVFTAVMEEGQPAVRASGQAPGTLTTRDEFASYHLRLEFKWGAGQPSSPRRAALVYHCPAAASLRNGNLPGLEYTLDEGNCGDLAVPLRAGITVETTGELVPQDGPERALPLVRYQPTGQRRMIPLGVQPRIRAAASPVKATGEWNTLEVLTFRDRTVHRLNGQLCLAIREARRWYGKVPQPLHRGRIQLRSAGAEIYFRNLLIRPLDRPPEELAR